MKFSPRYPSFFFAVGVIAALTFGIGKNQARAQDIKFQHISPDEGYSFGNVWGVLEDHEGFMWFATDDGLVRYNGYDLVTYRNHRSDPGSISANFSIILLEDRYNQLWVGTFGGGLNLYDRDTDSFRRFLNDPKNPNSLPHNRVKTMIESQDGKIWLGTEGRGLVTFDPNPKNLDSLVFRQFDHPKLDKSDPNIFMIRSVCEDAQGNIYIGSLSGITVLDKERKDLVQLRVGDSYPNLLASNSIVEVFIDSKQRLWIGTMDKGLQLYLPEEKRVINYAPSKADNTLNDAEIETITEDKNGTIWVGSDNGLSRILDSSSPVPANLFNNYYYQRLNESSLLSNSIKIVYADSRNSLWVGSYYGGINCYNPKLYKFTPIRNKPWVSTSLNHNNVTSFAEDNNHNIYIGTDGGGLSILKNPGGDMLQDNYSGIRIQSSKNRDPETKIKTLQFDHNGILWIGYWAGGLYSYNPKNGRTIYYGPGDQSDSGLIGIRILDIEIDKNNNVWVATFDEGISYYNRQTGKFKNYLPSTEPNVGIKGDRFNALLIDSSDRLWVGGDLGGLNLYNPQTDAFERIELDSLLDNNVPILSLMESEKHEICIGTVASGIIIYNPETGEYRNFTEKSGLPNNVVHGMLQDRSGNIWLSTNMGISSLDYTTGTITNYTRTDGLQGNQFNNGSCYKTSNGMMLFGGTNGWIHKSKEAKKIVFTNLWVNGKLIGPGDDSHILTSDLNSGNPINLNHTQKSFTVEFAVLDYNFSQINQYAYLLEGFDSDWQYNGTDRKAVFTNLSPGNYRLRIKATNHDGFWFEKGEVLEINIIPAWWQTDIFTVSVIILIVSLVYTFYRIRINFLVNQRRKLEKTVEQRTIQLRSKNIQLHEKNDEIQAQNEELFAQNEQINLQRDELEKTQEELRNINEQLEDIVKQRTEKLETTIKQLDKTVLELDRFVYSASHDLSSPLKSIKGLIEIVKIEKEPEKILTCVEHMIKSVDSLENVIKSLVDYSKNAHLEIEKTPVNLNDLTREVISELMYWPEAKKVHFELPEDKSLNVHSDQSRLKIILHNLIGNSVKYADPRKANPFIRFEFALNKNTWEFRVSDNGIGIDNEHLGKIFNMYYRASENSKGSGLGLFIVRESVNKIGGSIKVQSTRGEGTTFTLKFPVK